MKCQSGSDLSDAFDLLVRIGQSAHRALMTDVLVARRTCRAQHPCPAWKSRMACCSLLLTVVSANFAAIGCSAHTLYPKRYFAIRLRTGLLADMSFAGGAPVRDRGGDDPVRAVGLERHLGVFVEAVKRRLFEFLRRREHRRPHREESGRKNLLSCRPAGSNCPPSSIHSGGLPLSVSEKRSVKKSEPLHSLPQKPSPSSRCLVTRTPIEPRIGQEDVGGQAGIVAVEEVAGDGRHVEHVLDVAPSPASRWRWSGSARD